MARRPSRILIPLAVLGLLLLAPAASAHERYSSPDGSITIVLGEKNEPVYTYDFTNLDIIISSNETGDPITGVEETLEATLIAPNGDELTQPIQPQHGSEGHYQFAEDYVLTMPGQYKVRLSGTINDIDVSGEYLLPGPRGPITDITFPNAELSDLQGLQDQIDALQAEVDSLRAEVETHDGGANTQAAPGPGLLALVGLVGLLAFLRQRRAA